MAQLVALAMPGGPDFVAELRRAWDQGHAVLPLDPRLAPASAKAVLEANAPHAIIQAGGERQRLRGGRPLEPGDALVMATSGTTGSSPKGVILTHAAVAASALATSAYLGCDAGTDRWLACLPLAHIGGLSVLTRALITGTDLVVHPHFSARAVMAAAAEGATLVSLVATTMARIEPRVFRAIVLGGSAPPACLPANAHTTYGMTETGSGVVYDGFPLEGVEIGVAPSGEISVRGPMLIRSYRDGTDPKDAQGWLATGDAGYFDDTGALVVNGRLTDMIITGGENVWPSAVEEVLRLDPRISEVAVAGRPDPEWGERVVAFVVATADMEPPSLEDLRARAKDYLSPWAAPKELVLVESLPRTSIGKVRRRAL
ncbi:MAG: class I adenylate-forming enzyme family protein [Acidimicrobiales bacterium]